MSENIAWILGDGAYIVVLESFLLDALLSDQVTRTEEQG